jgi:hypothetical protein
MTAMVQVALAEGVTEAEEIQEILSSAGIESELRPAVEQHPAAIEDTPQKVLVPEHALEEALHAIEALSEPDDIAAD